MSRLLVVDDEPAMRSALQANFSRRGWQVETASGAKEAITRFRRGRHPLVITDIRMPDGNGIEVMREIQSTSSRTAIITAYCLRQCSGRSRGYQEGRLRLYGQASVL
jgi:DNA-binding NtrC family response regulator